MGTFASGLGPGMQTTLESQEAECRWLGERVENRTLDFLYTISSTAADAGNTPTTVLRGGLVMAVKASDSKLYQYDPTATDGTQNPVGILPQTTSTLDGNGTATDKTGVAIWVGGAFDPAQVLTTTGTIDARAQRILTQRGFVFNVCPADIASSTAQLGSEAFHGGGTRTAYKAADYTVTAADNGTRFFATTGAVNFTLPTIAPGLAYEFIQTTNNNLVVTGSTNILTTNNAGASSITYSTANLKLGSQLRVEAVRVGSAYLWLASNIGGTTMTIA